MKRFIDTPNGKYEYQLKILYEGVKKIDKEKATRNLLLFNEIANRNNLKFGLLFGTFLGAMREHDIIEHDEDMDLFVLEENKQVFFSMLFELRENGFEVIRYDRRGDMCSLMRNGEYIDVSFFKPICRGVRVSSSYLVPERFLINQDLYPFLGSEFHGPKEWENYLLFWYGASWKTPIQRDDFNMAIWKIALKKIMLLFYFVLPNRILKRIVIRRIRPKIERYNDKVDTFNQIIEPHYLEKIDIPQNVLEERIVIIK